MESLVVAAVSSKFKPISRLWVSASGPWRRRSAKPFVVSFQRFSLAIALSKLFAHIKSSSKFRGYSPSPILSEGVMATGHRCCFLSIINLKHVRTKFRDLLRVLYATHPYGSLILLLHSP